MKIYYNYHFYIIDNEFGEEYEFEAYFINHCEASRFITENFNVGNVVTVTAPYTEVLMYPEDLPR